MTLAVWHGLAADESSGDLVVLASPSVTVTDRSDGSTPQVYDDRDGNTALGNPFTAGANGDIEFYVPPGRYRIEADDGSGNTVTWDDELIGTLHGIDSPTDGNVPEYDAANNRYRQRPAGNLDPEHATDSATDTYASATNTGTPTTGATIVRDFQSSNTTTTPTLDGTTIKTRDGSALWSGAINGVHVLQYDGTDYLLLDTVDNIPTSTDLLDEDDMASDSDTAVPTQQSVKAYADTQDSSFEQQRAQAWVNFDGTGTISIRDSYNVSSITDRATGQYTVNYSSDLADANYAPQITAGIDEAENVRFASALSVGSCEIDMLSIDGTFEDASIVSFVVFGGN